MMWRNRSLGSLRGDLGAYLRRPVKPHLLPEIGNVSALRNDHGPIGESECHRITWIETPPLCHGLALRCMITSFIIHYMVDRRPQQVSESAVRDGRHASGDVIATYQKRSNSALSECLGV